MKLFFASVPRTPCGKNNFTLSVIWYLTVNNGLRLSPLEKSAKDNSSGRKPGKTNGTSISISPYSYVTETKGCLWLYIISGYYSS